MFQLVVLLCALTNIDAQNRKQQQRLKGPAPDLILVPDPEWWDQQKTPRPQIPASPVPPVKPAPTPELPKSLVKPIIAPKLPSRPSVSPTPAPIPSPAPVPSPTPSQAAPVVDTKQSTVEKTQAFEGEEKGDTFDFVLVVALSGVGCVLIVAVVGVSLHRRVISKMMMTSKLEDDNYYSTTDTNQSILSTTDFPYPSVSPNRSTGSPRSTMSRDTSMMEFTNNSSRRSDSMASSAYSIVEDSDTEIFASDHMFDDSEKSDL